ncbi:ImmA/IrrE family metallo-endopeptidase [bacterium]|nr:ImmA/IrrE family metallo-endopeptidase [bacterium]
MGRSITASINPELLRWARESAGYDVAAAAKRIHQSEDRLCPWENGKEQPTIAMLREVARVYKRAFSVFFLDNRPPDFEPLPDFRHLPGDVSTDFSPKLRYLIRRSRMRQEWLKEMQEFRGAQPLAYVASAGVNESIPELASCVRDLLGVSIAPRASWRQNHNPLRTWIDAVEKAGTFVFQSSDVNQDKMRGFALIDHLAPVILINGKDPSQARSFTLFHEFSHILLGKAGVSNVRFVHRGISDAARIEVFSNALAAEVLVPAKTLREDISTKKMRFRHELEAKVNHLAKLFKVSRDVIIRRLRDLEFIYQTTYGQQLARLSKEEELWREREILRRQKNEKKGGPPRARMVIRDNGRSFTGAALEAYSDGMITVVELARLLKTKAKHIAKIEQEVFLPASGAGF